MKNTQFRPKPEEVQSLDLGEEGESTNDIEEQQDRKKARRVENQEWYFQKKECPQCWVPLRSHEAITENRPLSLLHGSHCCP